MTLTGLAARKGGAAQQRVVVSAREEVWNVGRAGEVHASPGITETAHLQRLPVDDLYVHQVEVRGVNICRCVEYLPDLGRSAEWVLGQRALCVRTTSSGEKMARPFARVYSGF